MLANKKVVVIGGGWAGLSAASELCHRGIKVDLFESNEYLGGRARSIKIDDLELDNGPHLVLRDSPPDNKIFPSVGHRVF
ncbi:MAG: FAD/NAD(P)-binding protein [Betaproteobacteria bacterium]